MTRPISDHSDETDPRPTAPPPGLPSPTREPEVFPSPPDPIPAPDSTPIETPMDPFESLDLDHVSIAR
jgi:hypothetical protein